jgi:hypothetical protein
VSFGQGGGVARLTVGGRLAVDGTVTADGVGSGSSGGNGGGGGAGGSIFITSGSMGGSGVVTADGGGLPAAHSGGGGGGHVAVVLTNGADFGAVTIRARGGSGGSASGEYAGAGTVYLRKAGDAYGSLIADNGGNGPTIVARTLINSNVTGRVFGNVSILGSAQVTLSTNETLTVNGNWTNTHVFTGVTNSTVAVVLSNPVDFTGSNALFNLNVTGNGTIRFQAGRTNSVSGLLSMNGPSLRSSVDGVFTYLKLATGATQSVQHVNVKDNSASPGVTILAGVLSTDAGNNVNWIFPPPPATMYILK